MGFCESELRSTVFLHGQQASSLIGGERSTPLSTATGSSHAHNSQHTPSTRQHHHLLTHTHTLDTFSISQWRPLLLPSSPSAPYWPSWSHLRLSDTSPYSLTKKNPLEVTCAVVSAGSIGQVHTIVAATQAKERELQKETRRWETTRGADRRLRQMIILASASVRNVAAGMLGSFQNYLEKLNLTLTSGRHLASLAVRSTKKRVFQSCEGFNGWNETLNMNWATIVE